MTKSQLLAPDYKETPYWHDQITPWQPGDSSDRDLPSKVDVLVVGSGYTGLNAALQTTRGGRSTLVIDSGDMGQGCSSRNGGQIGTSIKPSHAKLSARFDAERATAIHAEGRNALEWIESFITQEEIDCDFKRSGRFHAAHTPAAYEALTSYAEESEKKGGEPFFAVPRSEQKKELGTSTYYGGVVFPRHASLHPAKYHRQLLDRVEKAGAQLLPHCSALALMREKEGWRVKTSKGEVLAREVVVATNGYSGNLVPWLQRRIIPIGSYMIATEEVSKDLIDELFPSDRVSSDSCRVIYYYRASPDRRRVIFGGRVSTGETDPKISGPRLHHDLLRIFPQLEGTRISHSWMGTVAYSFDELAHCGEHEGLHYAMAYCGSGVSMSSYLGMRMGLRILGKAEGKTAFDNLPFPTRPLYFGKPWFLPAAVAWFRLLDRLECHKAALHHP